MLVYVDSGVVFRVLLLVESYKVDPQLMKD